MVPWSAIRKPEYPCVEMHATAWMLWIASHGENMMFDDVTAWLDLGICAPWIYTPSHIHYRAAAPHIQALKSDSGSTPGHLLQGTPMQQLPKATERESDMINVIFTLLFQASGI